MTDKTSTAPVMSLKKVRDQIYAFATAQDRDKGLENYYVEMNVLVMDDWWQGIDAHLKAPTPDVVGGDVVGWHAPDEIPSTKPNDRDFFQIAVRRKRSDKVFSFPAVYCNSLALTVEYDPEESSGNRWSSHFLSEELADEGEMGFTGWWDVKSNSEYDTYYEPALEDGDELIGWCELPQWGAVPRVQGDAVAAEKIACPACSGDQGHLGSNMGYVPCRDCDGAGFIEDDDKDASHPAVQPKGNIVVGSWPWLRGVLAGMPSREEVLGRQRHQYLNRDEVLGWVDEGERRAALPHPVEQTMGNGCPCEPSGSDGLSCLGKDGRLLCDPKHKPEQTRGDGVEVWMIRRNDGEVHWDETGCVFHDEASASQEARLMTDSDPDGYSFGAFALHSGGPRQAVPDGWQPIETAPLDETVFCYDPMLGRFPGFQRIIREGCGSTIWTNSYTKASGIVPPTLWQPLPAAPSAGRMGVDK